MKTTTVISNECEKSFPSPFKIPRWLFQSLCRNDGGEKYNFHPQADIQMPAQGQHNSIYQKGNALWFILVAIGLLGLLTVMMSRSSSTSNETGGYEQNVIAANEILSYAKNLENAVQGLLARGCSENEISFWHDSDGNGLEQGSDDYYNASAPTDHSCHIFDVAGAGLSWETPKENWLDSSESGKFNYQTYIYKGETRIFNVEVSSKDDLLLIISWINKSICELINKNLYDDIVITEDPAGWSYSGKFQGIYDISSSSINLTSYAPHNGQTTACFTSESHGGYHFYHALHAR